MEHSRSPRILIFATAYHPFVGGAEIAVKEITDRLPGQHFDLLTVNLNGKEKSVEKIGNVNVYRVGKGSWGKFLFPVLGFFKARALHKQHGYDIAWSIMASQASIAAAFFRMSTNVKLVLTLQEGDEENHLARYVGGNQTLYKLLIRPWHHLVFKKADRVTAISTYLKERAQSVGVMVPIDIVPNGVDVEKFTQEQTESDKTSLLKKIGKKEGDIILITTSRLVEKNAVGDIVEALIHLPPHYKLLIVGAGPQERAVKHAIDILGITNRVMLVGYVESALIPLYLSISDIFIRASLSEGFGNSFIEAMASGIPVIATPVGGITDFITDGETGLFCGVKNPKSIASKVLVLNEDSILREKIVRQARQLSTSKYDWKTSSEKMKHAFENTLK